MDLVEFLLARIAEDEAAAREVAKASPGAWAALPVGLLGLSRHMSHVNFLAECDAKRRIVEWCSERNRVWAGNLGDDPTDPANYVPGDYAHQDDAPVLRLLALSYADHPDYREEWRPQ